MTLSKTLVDNVWQAVGVGQTISWEGTITDNVGFYDANGDGFADPGKYAFIVEGSDRAGNLTLKKWGGTVWVQNNVLFLRGPEQLDFAKAGVVTPEANPDPHYISPNGNSTQLAQKRARFYFMTDLSLNPESNVPKPAERIEASMAVHTKAVGKYSVKVYGNVGLSNLVRTIVQDATVEAASLTYEDWNGKNDAGQFVPNGTYYIVAAEKDYANNPSTPSLWQRSVTVDNSSPEVSSVSAAPYYFSATGATILT